MDFLYTPRIPKTRISSDQSKILGTNSYITVTSGAEKRDNLDLVPSLTTGVEGVEGADFLALRELLTEGVPGCFLFLT